MRMAPINNTLNEDKYLSRAAPENLDPPSTLYIPQIGTIYAYFKGRRRVLEIIKTPESHALGFRT